MNVKKMIAKKIQLFGTCPTWLLSSFLLQALKGFFFSHWDGKQAAGVCWLDGLQPYKNKVHKFKESHRQL